MLEGAGLSNVKTYIQSGNVVFQTRTTDKRKISRLIRTAIGKSHDFTPEALILSREDLQDAIASNPFPAGDIEPKTLHLCFLFLPPATPDIPSLEALRGDGESFELIKSVFYLYAPDGIGRSRLASTIEKAMGVALTARNWRSVKKIMSMAADLAE